MNKNKQGRKFNRESAQRKALIQSLSRELFLKEKIKTTTPKAKELKRFAEKFITIAKKGDISSRRRLGKYFSDTVVKKLVDEIAPRYKTRNGGYTRVTKLDIRKSDAASISIIELVN